MVKIPQENWRQPNNSDKFGNVWRTKNIKFDKDGYAQLSPRLVRLFSDNDDADFGFPLAFGRQAVGEFQLVTSDANWYIDLDTSNKTILEDTGTSNPDPSLDGDGSWFGGLWHVSTATAVLSRPATGGAIETYTSRITGLTSGKRHIIRPFKSRNSICVSNGNTVVQKDSSYGALTTLTIPADYEISGMAYNADRMGIITRLANDGTYGQDQEAAFFSWNGSSTGALGYNLGSDAGLGIIPYMSSFVILNREGQLMYWNGGGFQILATFPFYFGDYVYNDPQDNNGLGNVYMEAVGDKINIHIGNELQIFNRKDERVIQEAMAGVWCYDPKVGLHHKYSLSNSPMYLFTVTSGNVNTSTDVMTISSGTVPQTGNIARPISLAGIGGLTVNQDYYIIKVSDTTFKLAETYAQAVHGDAIDLTSATAGSNYFWVLNHIDYGTTQYDSCGAIRTVSNTANSYAMYTDIIAGGRLLDTDLSNVEALCIAVPWLENRGIIETPKIFASEIKDIAKILNIGIKPLNDASSINIYIRTKDVLGLPVSTSGKSAIWTGKRDLYTTQDLSEAEAYINTGGELLLEITAGVGAGHLLPVEDVSSDNGTYAIQLKNDVFCVSAGAKSEFILYNYSKKRTITNADDTEITIGLDEKAGKFVQFLIEPVGYDITIEYILPNIAPYHLTK